MNTENLIVSAQANLTAGHSIEQVAYDLVRQAPPDSCCRANQGA
jgi:hypothetical protein